MSADQDRPTDQLAESDLLQHSFQFVSLAEVHPGLEVRAFNVLVGSNGDNVQAVCVLKLLVGRHCSPGHSAHSGVLGYEASHRDLA